MPAGSATDTAAQNGAAPAAGVKRPRQLSLFDMAFMRKKKDTTAAPKEKQDEEKKVADTKIESKNDAKGSTAAAAAVPKEKKEEAKKVVEPSKETNVMGESQSPTLTDILEDKAG